MDTCKRRRNERRALGTRDARRRPLKCCSVGVHGPDVASPRSSMGIGDEVGQEAVTPVLVVLRACPVLALLPMLLGCGAKELKEAFEPPDTGVVGQALGSALAIAYTASLAQHA